MAFESWARVWLEVTADPKPIKKAIEDAAKSARGDAAGKQFGGDFAKGMTGEVETGMRRDLRPRVVKEAGVSGKAAGQEGGRSLGQSLTQLSGGIAKSFWTGFRANHRNAADAGDEAGRTLGASLTGMSSGIAKSFWQGFTKDAGDGGRRAGDEAGKGFAAAFTKHTSGLGKGIAGGGGPNILGLNFLSKAGAIGGAGVLGLGALPALAGGALGAGVAAGGVGALAGLGGIVQSQVTPARQAVTQAQAAVASATTPAQAQAAQAKLAAANAEVAKLSPALQQIIKSEDAIQSTWKKFASSLAPLMVGPIGQVAALLPQLTGPLHQMFAGAATIAKPLIDGLGQLAKDVLPLLGQAFRAVAPMITPLLVGLNGLLSGILPGLIALLKAAMPAVLTLAAFLGNLGNAAGALLSSFAPVIRESSKVLAALLDIVTALLPFIGQLAAVFAKALAPVMGAFAGLVKALLPILVLVAKVIGELAAAVIGDLVSAFGAIVTLFRAIAPALTAFLAAFSQVFKVLENSGVFGVLAAALESLAKPLATVINALLKGLTPILPPIIKFIGDLASMLAAGLAKAIIALLPPLTKLATNVLAALAGLLPVLLPLLTIFVGIFTAVAVRLVQDLATALGVLIAALPPGVLQAIAYGFIAIWAAIKIGGLVSAASNPILLIGVAVGLLIIAIVELVKHWSAVWGAISRVASTAWKAVWSVTLGPMITFFTKLLPAAFNTALTWVRQHWPLMLALLAGPIGLAVLAIVKHWDTIKATFKAGWDWIWAHTITPMATFFLQTLPHWWDVVVGGVKQLWTRAGSAFTAGWNWIWAHTVVPMQTFFTKTLPHWWDLVVGFTKLLWTREGDAFRAGWDWIWQHTVVPMQTFFLKTVPHWWDLTVAGVRSLWTRWGNIVRDGWNWIVTHVWNPVRQFMTVTVPGWWDTAVKAIKGFWDRLGQIVKVPVNFLIGTVYDNGIRAFWNAIVSKIPGIPNLPMIAKLARGGRLPGYGGGDRQPALLESGETVVDKASSRLPFMVAAFRAAGVPGYQAGGKVGQNPPQPISAAQARFGSSVAPTGGSGGLPGGGVLHNIGNFISGDIFHFFGKAFDLAKIAAGVLSGNTTAAANALGDMIGVPGGTTGPLAQMMLGIPKRIVKGLVGLLVGAGQATGSGADIAKFAETFLGKIPYTWGGVGLTASDCSGFVQGVYEHFGMSPPRTSEAQGAWVKRTGPQSGGLAFYHSPAGGPDPGHVAIVKNASTVISQGGGMGPKLMALHGMPLLWTGIPPQGFGGASGGKGGTPANAGLMAGYFASHGFTRNAIAGLLGNIQQESGGNPMAGTNPPGRGLIQILGDPGGSLGQELDRTMAYIAANGSVADINAHATSAAAAATWFCNHYERPGIPQLANRIASANASYAAGYANGGWINEPVVGVGRYTKAVYNFGEAGREYVTPEAQMRGAAGPGAGAPLIGAYHTNYYGTGDTAEAMRELTFTLRRAKQGAFFPAGS